MSNEEFLKYILKYRDIRPIEEAFEEFPVEEEEHKGKNRNIFYKNTVESCR